MDWKAVIKEFRAEAERQRKVILDQRTTQDIRFGAAITLAVISIFANALEKGDAKKETIQ